MRNFSREIFKNLTWRRRKKNTEENSWDFWVLWYNQDACFWPYDYSCVGYTKTLKNLANLLLQLWKQYFLLLLFWAFDSIFIGFAVKCNSAWLLLFVPPLPLCYCCLVSWMVHATPIRFRPVRFRPNDSGRTIQARHDSGRTRFRPVMLKKFGHDSGQTWFRPVTIQAD